MRWWRSRLTDRYENHCSVHNGVIKITQATGSGQKAGTLTLKTTEMESTYDLGAKMIDALTKQKVSAGFASDVMSVFIFNCVLISVMSSPSTRRPAKLTSSAGPLLGPATTMLLEPRPSLCRARRVSCRSARRSCTLSGVPSDVLFCFDFLFVIPACTRSTSSTAARKDFWRSFQVSFASSFRIYCVRPAITGDTGEIKQEVREQINAKVAEWREEGKADIVPGVRAPCSSS